MGMRHVKRQLTVFEKYAKLLLLLTDSLHFKPAITLGIEDFQRSQSLVFLPKSEEKKAFG